MSQTFAGKAKEYLQQACSDVNSIPGAIFAAADRDGNLIAHEAGGVIQAGNSTPVEKDMLAWMASCTKLITAIACLQQVEKGKLDLDSPIHDKIPEISAVEDKVTTPITLRHLLTHTAGMSYPFFNPETNLWFKNNRESSFSCTKKSISGPLNSEPGSKWEYSTSMDWAGLAVERVSSLDLDTYFKRNIFEPLGIKEITLKPQTGLAGKSVLPRLLGMNFKDKNGIVTAQRHVIEQEESKIEILYGGAGAYGNAAEYVQILVALLNNGTHPITKKEILTPSSVEELFRDQLDDNLVKDLYKDVPAAQPELTNPVSLPGDHKQWTIGGLKAYDGPEKKHSFVWWAGIANHFWFINQELGVCAMIQTQIFPFNDLSVISLFFGQLQSELQKVQ